MQLKVEVGEIAQIEFRNVQREHVLGELLVVARRKVKVFLLL